MQSAEEVITSSMPEFVKEKIRQNVGDGTEAQDASNNTSHTVSESLCKVINEKYENGAKQSDIVDELPISSRSTVAYHVNDKCSHSRSHRITRDECGWIRKRASDGKQTKAIAEEFNIAKRTARRHITGNCGHGEFVASVTLEQKSTDNK